MFIPVPDLYAQVARSGMQHYPQPILIVCLQFEEMIASAQGAKLPHHFP
ncbi:MAG: hypothetical protein U1G07_17120 [Verrucomicrobiota bacterium]